MILKNKNNNFLLTLSIVLILMGIVIFSFFSQKRAPVTPEKASMKSVKSKRNHSPMM